MEKCEGCNKIDEIAQQSKKSINKIESFESLLRSSLKLFAEFTRRQYDIEKNDNEIKKEIQDLKYQIDNQNSQNNYLIKKLEAIDNKIPSVDMFATFYNKK